MHIYCISILDEDRRQERTNKQKKTQIVASATCQVSSNNSNNAYVYGCPYTGWKYRQSW
jgi:hypothetical protein